jgi:transcriptional regulator with XRE-family HTH domain
MKNNNLTFSDYYQELRKESLKFVAEIMKATGKSERTVYNWIKGKNLPKKNDRETISSVLKIPENILFPNLKS